MLTLSARVTQFVPHEAIEPQEFGFVLNVVYSDADEALFAQSVYNGTVAIADSVTPFDYMSAVKPLIVLAVFGYLANQFFNGGKSPLAAFGGKPAKKEAAAPAVETGTKAKAVAKDDDWLANLNVAKTKCVAACRGGRQLVLTLY